MRGAKLRKLVYVRKYLRRLDWTHPVAEELPRRAVNIAQASSRFDNFTTRHERKRLYRIY